MPRARLLRSRILLQRLKVSQGRSSRLLYTDLPWQIIGDALVSIPTPIGSPYFPEGALTCKSPPKLRRFAHLAASITAGISEGRQANSPDPKSARCNISAK